MGPHSGNSTASKCRPLIGVRWALHVGPLRLLDLVWLRRSRRVRLGRSAEQGGGHRLSAGPDVLVAGWSSAKAAGPIQQQQQQQHTPAASSSSSSSSSRPLMPSPLPSLCAGPAAAAP
ncbi:uncharacterized protein PSFLO_02716 [Pseudozyma flocculosa]|uniref:Uncharacterized protein n=1 Tax=Pseudozyma flocculosa TaxID=84751 RepID=A0A5C3EYB6_9BASI|nr:uncharacterized protein PSFLO_02716 [Pseudozyma flocculosa]